MKYYTIEEAAALLPYRTPDGKPDVEFTFDLTTGKPQRDGNPANVLWPSAVFESHVKVQRVKTTGKRVVESHLADYGGGQEHFAEEEVLIGCFGVAGERGGLLTWHKGVAKVYRVDDASVKDGYRTIKRDQLRISAVALHSFMDQENMLVPLEVQKEVPGGTAYSREVHDLPSCPSAHNDSPLHPPPGWLQRLPEVFTLEEAAKIMQDEVECLLVKLFENAPVASRRFGRSVSFVRSDDDEEKPFQCNDVVHFLFIGNVRGRMAAQGLKGKIEILPRGTTPTAIPSNPDEQRYHEYFGCKALLYVLDNDSPTGRTFISPRIYDTIGEHSLVVTRESLWEYAVSYVDLRERLEAMAEGHRGSDDPVLSRNLKEANDIPDAEILKLPDRNQKIHTCREKAAELLKKGLSRDDVARNLRESGYTLEIVGEVLTFDGQARSRESWERRASSLIKTGKVPGERNKAKV